MQLLCAKCNVLYAESFFKIVKKDNGRRKLYN